MNHDDIIRMAREADPFGEQGRLYQVAVLTPETMEHFAVLVAAAEREECAKECEAGGGFQDGYSCAAAIRARGNHD